MTAASGQPAAVPPAVKAAGEGKDKHTFLPGQDPEGKFIFSVLFKRSYDIVPDDVCKRAKKDVKIHTGPVYHGDPKTTSVRYDTDFIPYKLATDVAFEGKAYSLGGVPVQNLKVALCVGEARKELLVIGNRICRWMDGGRIAATPPEPFSTMEIRYENAYGGVDIYSDPVMPCDYPANPLGKGFVIKPTPKSLLNLPLPNLEDPKARLSAERLCILDAKNWERQPLPAGFGWVPSHWYPRAALAGILPGDVELEKSLREIFAKALPKDQKELYLKHPMPKMNFAYFNGASAGLTFPYLKGTETIALENLSPEGTLKFRLPGETPSVRLDIGFGLQDAPAVLHTVQIRGEDRQVDLSWRAAIPYPGPDWLQNMRYSNLLMEWSTSA